MTGAELIHQERERQKYGEQWTAEHDDEHEDFQMSDAAVSYILNVTEHGNWQTFWPWGQAWFKPKDAIRDLARAGALLAAEIDRLQRMEANEQKNATADRE